MKAVTNSNVASPKFWWGQKYFDFKRATVFFSGHCLSKHKMTSYARNLEGHGPFGPCCAKLVFMVFTISLLYSHRELKHYILYSLENDNQPKNGKNKPCVH